MVHIKLSEKYDLRDDPNCWIILEEGRPKWFFSTLYDALEDWICNELPKGSKATTTSGLLEFLKQQQERLYTLLTALKKEDMPQKLPIIKGEKGK